MTIFEGDKERAPLVEPYLERAMNKEHTINNGYVVAADIGGTSVRVALADMSGSILSKWSASTEGTRDPDKVVQLIRDGADCLFEENGIVKEFIRAIAAGAPGVVDVNRGIVLATSYLMGWKDVPLQLMLEKHFGVPAAIENDVNLAAIAERDTGSAHGASDFVFLAVGTGIGAGIILNGRLHHGMNWRAGEVGYMLVPGTSTAPVQNYEPGALEAIAGGAGIKQQWHLRWHECLSSLPEDTMASAVFDEALRGNALARQVLDGSARTLAYAIFNLSVVLNCRLFVLGGTIGLHPAYLTALQEHLEKLGTRERLMLVASSLGVDAQLAGAILLARETASRQDQIASHCG